MDTIEYNKTHYGLQNYCWILRCMVKYEIYMSGDQVNYSKVNNINTRTNRVDINDLMSRVRDDEKKQKKENLVFFSLIASVIVITGIIASL